MQTMILSVSLGLYVCEHLSGVNMDHLLEFVFVEPNSFLSVGCPQFC